jgi:hypothetical protein
MPSGPPDQTPLEQTAALTGDSTPFGVAISGFRSRREGVQFQRCSLRVQHALLGLGWEIAARQLLSHRFFERKVLANLRDHGQLA